MIKGTSILLLSFVVSFLSIPELEPRIGRALNFSLEGELEFIQQNKDCERLQYLARDQRTRNSLSSEEVKKLENCDGTASSYWDVLGPGCSWYCGGGVDTLSATSFLTGKGKFDYHPQNIHDLSYETAWVEGVEGQGIGEAIIFHFPPGSPRITNIIIANGYVKSEKTWKDNSRVKKLKMYVNDKPFAILNLLDSRREQEYTFEPLGESNRASWEQLEDRPWWTIKFEILEVYPGEVYDDTAISEIYFDGIDVH